jgi:hypothetical protein
MKRLGKKLERVPWRISTVRLGLAVATQSPNRSDFLAGLGPAGIAATPPQKVARAFDSAPNFDGVPARAFLCCIDLSTVRDSSAFLAAA